MAKPYMCGDEMPVYIPDGGCDCNYTLEQVESIDYAVSYALMLNGEQVGQTVNVPKDVYVSRGNINTVVTPDVPYEGAIVGDKYLTLSFYNNDSKVNIPMKELVSASYVIVEELPEEGSASVIYLVPRQGGGYDRYIYSNNEWVNIGDAQIDLSNYYTKAETDALFNGYIKEDEEGDASISRNLELGGSCYAQNYYCTSPQVSLGSWYGNAIVTGDGKAFWFSIPTGRVFKPGTTISKVTCSLVARISNAAGGGEYVISGSSGISLATLDTSTSFRFYNANHTQKTISASNIACHLYGGTNIIITLTGTDNYTFTGTSAKNANLNDNAATTQINDIVVHLNIPS